MAEKKNYNYFSYFCDISEIICEAAAFLDESINNYSPDGFDERVEKMHAIENRADAAKHEMIKKLMHEFITPIEREDIVELSQELDSVVDAMDDVMQRMYMFNLDAVLPEAVEFTKLIVDCTDELKEALTRFKNFKTSKTIQEKIVNVNTLESMGDFLHSRAYRELFSNDNDSRTLLIWTTIFEDLELCLDKCEDAVDIIEGVIMKNT